MSASSDHGLYRLRRTCRDGLPAKHYRGTFELSDDATKQVLATCDLMGMATFREHEIVDGRGQVWHLRANRAVMPSRWLLLDPSQKLALQFHQQILRKLLNPWQRTGLALLSADERPLLRLVDPRTGVLDRIFGPRADDWVLMQGDRPVARLVRLPNKQEASRGVLGRIGKLLSQADQGIASASSTHVLGPPAALALLMLVNELTESSVAS